jgi:tripartite-type tricarboxylate transporter receptor subunit TctC
MKVFILSVVLGLLAVVDCAHAQPYPARPIRLIVPYPPGGGADIVARIIADKLSESLNQPVVVDNRAGANGNIGTAAIATAAPDGYTIGVASPGPMSMAALYPTLTYDPARDLAPVILTYESPILLVVKPGLPVQNVSDLVKLAKSQPGRLNAALSGIGSIQHMLVEMLKDAGQIKFESIPYKGGAPAAVAVMAGQVDFTFSVLPIAVPYVDAGKMRALAVTSEKRTSLLPNLATTSEEGWPAVTASNWNGICAPAGTPKEIIDKLNVAIGSILALPETRKRFASIGVTALGGTADQFADFLRHDTEKWSTLINRLHIKAE